MSRIHLSTKGVHEFTPPALDGRASKPVFLLHIPTYHQRDTLGQLLFSHGLVPVTIEQGRAVLISELYEVFDAEKADDDASFLEGFWQRTEVYNQMVEDWSLQERERLIDIANGAPASELPKKDMPARPFTVREQARAQRLATEMLSLSEPYRTLQSQYGNEEANEALMLFRVFVAGWSGLKTSPVMHESGKLTEQCVEDLRSELDKEFGCPAAYKEVVREIRSLFVVDRETEKNFESPLGSGSSPSGSPASSAELDASAGSWMGSNTEPTPPSASPQTTVTSSSSPSAPKRRTKKSGPTAGH